MERLVLWSGADPWLTEATTVELTGTGVSASGTQLGVDPVPYRVDYTLDAAHDFVTRSLSVESSGDGWSRGIRLTHDGAGGWRCESDGHGNVDLPAPGGDPKTLVAARDCDLGYSPLTNLMPIRRYELDRRPGSADVVVAWVSVPDLGVRPYPQRYEHLRADAAGAVVRFTSLGIHDGFVSELELDRDGLVVVYPQLARRVGRDGRRAPPSAAAGGS